MNIDWHRVGIDGTIFGCSTHDTGIPDEEFHLIVKRTMLGNWITHIYRTTWHVGDTDTIHEVCTEHADETNAIINADMVARYDVLLHEHLYGKQDVRTLQLARVAEFVSTARKGWWAFQQGLFHEEANG